MFYPQNLPISIKLVGGFFAILVLVFVSGLYSITITRQALHETVGQNSVFLAEDTLQQIDKDIFLKIEGIELFVKNEVLQKAISSSNDFFDGLEKRDEYIASNDQAWRALAEDETSPFMEELIGGGASDVLRREFIDFWEEKYGTRIYGEAFVANKYGGNVAQTGRTSDYWQADEEWWQEAKKKGFYVGKIEYDESAQVWSMPLSVRVDDREGNFAGVIKVIPSVRELVREVELTIRKYKTTDLRLLTKEGGLIYSSRPFRTMEDLSQSKIFSKIDTENKFFIAEEGKEKLFAYAHSQGFRNFEGLGWILLVSHEAEEVFAPVAKLQQALTVTSLLFAFFVVALAFLFSKIVSLPIRKITKAAERIASGNLEVRILARSRDEVGQLADAFNLMADKLKRSYENLEQKIKNRTVELEEKVQELDKTAKLLVRRDFELLQANEKLREMDEAKSRFVSIAAHQLRTPLSSVKWASQMLLAGDFGRITKEQKEILQESYGTIQRLIALVGDLLNVARIEEGRVIYNLSLLQAEEICKKVFEESRVAAESKGLKFNLLLPAKPLPPVLGDSANLTMALQNVVDNALTYTNKGGKVEMGAEKDRSNPRRLRIFVRDNGIGIPDTQKNLIGQKFFRADNAAKGQTSGTGLGLYIVNRILEKQGGKLEFESRENRGSAFFLLLPFSEE